MRSYLQTVAADGLITRARVKAVMEAWSSGHQQTADPRAVTLKHSHTFMTLQQSDSKMQDCCVAMFADSHPDIQ